jgi:hypothetical protein
MIITITGPKKSVRLVVHEDCALSRYQYRRLRQCTDCVWGSHDVIGINRHLWDRILLETEIELFGERWAIIFNNKRNTIVKNQILNRALDSDPQAYGARY